MVNLKILVVGDDSKCEVYADNNHVGTLEQPYEAGNPYLVYSDVKPLLAQFPQFQGREFSIVVARVQSGSL